MSTKMEASFIRLVRNNEVMDLKTILAGEKLHGTTNITIFVKDGLQITCHRSLLALFSPLMSFLLAPCSPCSPCSITIYLPDYTVNVVNSLILLLCGDKATDINNEEVCQVRELAGDLGVGDLGLEDPRDDESFDNTILDFSDDGLDDSVEDISYETDDIIDIQAVSTSEEDLNKSNNVKKEIVEDLGERRNKSTDNVANTLKHEVNSDVLDNYNDDMSSSSISFDDDNYADINELLEDDNLMFGDDESEKIDQLAVEMLIPLEEIVSDNPTTPTVNTGKLSIEHTEIIKPITINSFDKQVQLDFTEEQQWELDPETGEMSTLLDDLKNDENIVDPTTITHLHGMIDSFLDTVNPLKAHIINSVSNKKDEEIELKGLTPQIPENASRNSEDCETSANNPEAERTGKEPDNPDTKYDTEADKLFTHNLLIKKNKSEDSPKTHIDSDGRLQCLFCDVTYATAGRALMSHYSTSHFDEELRVKFRHLVSGGRCSICQNKVKGNKVSYHLGAVHKFVNKLLLELGMTEIPEKFKDDFKEIQTSPEEIEDKQPTPEDEIIANTEEKSEREDEDIKGGENNSVTTRLRSNKHMNQNETEDANVSINTRFRGRKSSFQDDTEDTDDDTISISSRLRQRKTVITEEGFENSEGKVHETTEEVSKSKAENYNLVDNSSETKRIRTKKNINQEDTEDESVTEGGSDSISRRLRLRKSSNPVDAENHLEEVPIRKRLRSKSRSRHIEYTSDEEGVDDKLYKLYHKDSGATSENTDKSRTPSRNLIVDKSVTSSKVNTNTALIKTNTPLPNKRAKSGTILETHFNKSEQISETTRTSTKKESLDLKHGKTNVKSEVMNIKPDPDASKNKIDAKDPIQDEVNRLVSNGVVVVQNKPTILVDSTMKKEETQRSISPPVTLKFGRASMTEMKTENYLETSDVVNTELLKNNDLLKIKGIHLPMSTKVTFSTPKEDVKHKSSPKTPHILGRNLSSAIKSLSADNLKENDHKLSVKVVIKYPKQATTKEEKQIEIKNEKDDDENIQDIQSVDTGNLHSLELQQNLVNKSLEIQQNLVNKEEHINDNNGEIITADLEEQTDLIKSQEIEVTNTEIEANLSEKKDYSEDSGNVRRDSRSKYITNGDSLMMPNNKVEFASMSLNLESKTNTNERGFTNKGESVIVTNNLVSSEDLEMKKKDSMGSSNTKGMSTMKDSINISTTNLSTESMKDDKCADTVEKKYNTVEMPNKGSNPIETSTQLGLYNCPLCPYIIDKKLTLRDHLSTIHYKKIILDKFSKNEGNTDCSLCGKTYSGPVQLSRHLGTGHKKLKEITTVHSKVYSVSMSSVPEGVLPCNSCSKCNTPRCTKCVACLELRTNPGVVDSVCFKRRCSKPVTDKEGGLDDDKFKRVESSSQLTPSLKPGKEPISRSISASLQKETERNTNEKNVIMTFTTPIIKASPDESIIEHNEEGSQRGIKRKSLTGETLNSPLPKTISVDDDTKKDTDEDLHSLNKLKCFKCSGLFPGKLELYEHFSESHFYSHIIKTFKPQEICPIPSCNQVMGGGEVMWVKHVGARHNIVEGFIPKENRVTSPSETDDIKNSSQRPVRRSKGRLSTKSPVVLQRQSQTDKKDTKEPSKREESSYRWWENLNQFEKKTKETITL